MVVGCMPELVRVGGPRRLLNLADAGGLGVEADYVFVAAIGEEFAIYFAGAADGFIGQDHNARAQIYLFKKRREVRAYQCEEPALAKTASVRD